MKVGVNIVHYGPSATPSGMQELVGRAHELGYHFIMLSDHIALTSDVRGRYPEPFHDPLTILAWLAGQFPGLQLGTSVMVLPYRHPLVLASMTSAVQRFTSDPLLLGVGIGWANQEFDALGIAFGQRAEISDEYLEVLTRYWDNHRFSYSGSHIKFRDVVGGGPPAGAPHPTIWVGGSSDAALRRAVRFSSGWHPIWPEMEWLSVRGVPRLRHLSRLANRPPPELCPRIAIRITGSPLGSTRRAGEGSLKQIRHDFVALASLGATHVLVDLHADDPHLGLQLSNDLRLLERIAAEILAWSSAAVARNAGGVEDDGEQ